MWRNLLPPCFTHLGHTHRAGRWSQPKAVGTPGTRLVVGRLLCTSYCIICWQVPTPGTAGMQDPERLRGRRVPGEVSWGHSGWLRGPELGFFSVVRHGKGTAAEGHHSQRRWVPGGRGKGQGHRESRRHIFKTARVGVGWGGGALSASGSGTERIKEQVRVGRRGEWRVTQGPCPAAVGGVPPIMTENENLTGGVLRNRKKIMGSILKFIFYRIF